MQLTFKAFCAPMGNTNRFPMRKTQYRILFLVLLALAFSNALQSFAQSGKTYYLAPASMGGSDGNSGASSGSPWLTPNHSVNCGDTVIALPSAGYVSGNFNSGKWGTVNCPGGSNVAMLECQSFDACKITSTNQGIYVDKSYWGVSGWEVTIASGAPGFCFGAAPNYTTQATVHHIVFADNVANGCQAGGFVSFNVGSRASVDYLTIVGNIVYNAIQGPAQCFNGISVFQPIQSDSASGTHIYVANNYVWGNYQHNPCGGVQAWGGDGIIFDTFDGSQGVGSPYGAQAMIDNNMTIGNGGHGIEVQNNIAGGQHAPIYVRRNTSWGNELDTAQQNNNLCAEVLVNSGYNVQVEYNLVSTQGAKACAGNSNGLFALSAYNVNGSVWVYNNFAYGHSGQNTWVWDGGSFVYDGNNTLNQDPSFKGPYVPSAPACNGTGTTTNCMNNVVQAFKAQNTAANGAGYQPPTSFHYDPMFPQWVCNVNLPSGLITRGCGG